MLVDEVFGSGAEVVYNNYMFGYTPSIPIFAETPSRLLFSIAVCYAKSSEIPQLYDYLLVKDPYGRLDMIALKVSRLI
jgi:hypothetical protein